MYKKLMKSNTYMKMIFKIDGIAVVVYFSRLDCLDVDILLCYYEFTVFPYCLKKKLNYHFINMSNSLVRKGLELLGYEKPVKQEKKKRKHTNYKGTLDLIPAKHRVLSRNDKTDLGTILGRSSKVTVYEARKKLATQKDPTNENVQRLLMLSNNRIDLDMTNKLLDRAVKKRCIPNPQKPKEPETTAFTEEDFKKFEKEYVDQ